MSFEVQETGYTCSVASLRYALSLLGQGQKGEGVEFTEKLLRKRLRLRNPRSIARDGVAERQLMTLARRCGLASKEHSFKKNTPDACISALEQATAKGHPCLVTWHTDTEDEGDNNHFHWVCVAGFTASGDVLLFDPYLFDDDESARRFSPVDDESEHVPGRMSRGRFRDWLVPFDEVEKGQDHQYFIELWPEDPADARFVPGRFDETLLARMRVDDELFREFDRFIDDLRTVFGSPQGVNGQLAGDFLEQHLDLIEKTAWQWVDGDAVRRSFIQAELKTLLALCRCYRFVVRPGEEALVAGRLGFHLGWRCCEKAFSVGAFEG